MTPTRPNRLILSLSSTALVLVGLGGPATAAAALDGPSAVDEATSAVDAATPTQGQAIPSSQVSRPRTAGDPLVGTFTITAGECGDEGVTGGSYFRMATPGGDPESGPWVNNSSSPCGDNTWTPLSPGRDGGLSTEGYQPHPDPAFEDGDALADRIIEPTGFNGTDFSVATSPVDPQTETDVPVPAIEDAGGELSGQTTAWAAGWNGQHFNQGSPKPDGEQPGHTSGPSGTYDPATGAFTLEWASLIVGGPFDNFTGLWHLEGTFEPATGSSGGSSPSTAPGGAATTPDDPAATSGSPTPATRSAGSGDLPRTGGVPVAMALLLAGGGLAGRRFLTART